MNRLRFLGSFCTAVIAAMFGKFGESDGLYPFQRAGIEYVRNGMKLATQSDDVDRAWTTNPDFPRLTDDEIEQIRPYLEFHGNTLVYWKEDPNHPASYNRSHRCVECAGFDRPGYDK